MDDKRSTNGGRPPEVSVRRGGQRKIAIGAMAPLALVAAVAMLWPGGGGPGPQRAEAAPSPTTIGREAPAAVKSKEGEGAKEGTKGSKGKKEAPKGTTSTKGGKGKKGGKGGKGKKEAPKGKKGSKGPKQGERGTTVPAK